MVGLFSAGTGGPHSRACRHVLLSSRVVPGQNRRPADVGRRATKRRSPAPDRKDERAHARANIISAAFQAPTRECALLHVPYSMLVATPRNVVKVFAVPDYRTGTHRAARRILPPADVF